ncbi:MAG: hypothetical protein KA020_09615 [Planctomycetes bacterium]|nr:hypothetical protein [Planctomycetota bacterium]MCC7064206.1 hypothetical protein [Planctomycetota bacterium]
MTTPLVGVMVAVALVPPLAVCRPSSRAIGGT